MHQDDIERIRRACEALCMDYARALDFRDYDAFVSLFTDDALLHVGEPLAGLAAIRAALRLRPDEVRSRHVVSNVFVDVQDEREARGISYLTLYRHNGPESLRAAAVPLDGPARVGHFEDRFLRCDDGWRFRSRRFHAAFSVALPTTDPVASYF